MSIAVSPSRQVAAARIGPDHDSETIRLRLGRHLGDVAHLVIGRIRARIDRVAVAAQPSRSASLTLAVTAWLAFSLKRDMLLVLLSFRIVGIRPAKVSAPASRKPSGAA